MAALSWLSTCAPKTLPNPNQYVEITKQMLSNDIQIYSSCHVSYFNITHISDLNVFASISASNFALMINSSNSVHFTKILLHLNASLPLGSENQPLPLQMFWALSKNNFPQELKAFSTFTTGFLYGLFTYSNNAIPHSLANSWNGCVIFFCYISKADEIKNDSTLDLFLIWALYILYFRHFCILYLYTSKTRCCLYLQVDWCSLWTSFGSQNVPLTLAFGSTVLTFPDDSPLFLHQ